jgi:hypothetical protein
VRRLSFLIEHVRIARTGDMAFELASLFVETHQHGKLLLAAEPGLCNRHFRHPYRLVVDRDRHRKGVPVLAAMGERKPRRVGKALGRAVDDLGDHRQQPHCPGADARDQQQFGKILRAGLLQPQPLGPAPPATTAPPSIVPWFPRFAGSYPSTRACRWIGTAHQQSYTMLGGAVTAGAGRGAGAAAPRRARLLAAYQRARAGVDRPRRARTRW